MVIKKSNLFNENQKVMLNAIQDVKQTVSSEVQSPTSSRGDSNLSGDSNIDGNLYISGNIYVNNADYSYEDEEEEENRDFEEDDDIPDIDESAGEGNLIAGGTIIGKDIYAKEHYYIDINGVKTDLLNDVILPGFEKVKNKINSLSELIGQNTEDIADISTRLKNYIDGNNLVVSELKDDVTRNIQNIASAFDLIDDISDNINTSVNKRIRDLSNYLDTDVYGDIYWLRDRVDELQQRVSDLESRYM